MFGELQRFIARATGLEPAEITPETRFGDLPLDSLGLAELLLALEEEYGARIPERTGEELDLARLTVGGLATFLDASS
jgi:acyl carrier protein